PSRRACVPVPLLYMRSPPPELYTLSLHDALPILRSRKAPEEERAEQEMLPATLASDSTASVGQQPALPSKRLQRIADYVRAQAEDRKSTRLNSSHVKISYAVFCLKKKKHTETNQE